MAERMPTPEDIAQMIQAIYGYQPGRTPANRFNYLQDVSRAINFDPFGLPYVPDVMPQEDLVSSTRIQYATDVNSPYAAVFDAIDRGVDPVSAARSAIASGVFGEDQVAIREEGLDRVVADVAREYSKDLIDIERRQRQFQQEQAKAAREAPVTLQEILYPASQYEIASMAAGKPEGLTEADLLADYSRRRFEQAEAGRRKGMERRAAQAKPETAAKPAGRDRIGMGGLLRAAGKAIGSIPLPSAMVGGAAVRAASNLPLVGGADLVSGRGGDGRSSAAGKVAPANIPQQRKVSDYGFSDDPNSIASLIAKDAARRALEVQRQTPVWRPEAQNVLRQLGYVNLLNQGAG